MCPKFKLSINNLYETQEFYINITKANAFLLSSDLATLFTDCYFELEVFPFSFKKFCEYYDLFDDNNNLEKYVKYMGFAGSYVYEHDEDKAKYILNVVVLKDIMKKNRFSNIFAIELLRRDYEVYVGKLYQKVIDFVAIKGNEKYIQVADNIDYPETLEKEITPLKTIRENYPKFILANPKHFDYDISVIKIIDLSSWLLKR